MRKLFSSIPGRHRLNLHAFYLEIGGKKVDRDEIESEHFRGWIDWAKQYTSGMEYNPSLFSHLMADSGFTFSSTDRSVREFWIEYCKRLRKIGEAIGRALGSTCVTNIWIPDGYKDIPVDRLAPRQHLLESLDDIISVPIDERYKGALLLSTFPGR